MLGLPDPAGTVNVYIYNDLEKLASSYANETGLEIEETRVSWAGWV